MNATNMVQGNLALKLETPAAPAFTESTMRSAIMITNEQEP